MEILVPLYLKSWIQLKIIHSKTCKPGLEDQSLTHFRYLNLPFDLSQVVFIATANDKSTIPAPLMDRMELIEMPSYSSQQKFQIARRHILPRQLTEHALSPDYLEIQVT